MIRDSCRAIKAVDHLHFLIKDILSLRLKIRDNYSDLPHIFYEQLEVRLQTLEWRGHFGYRSLDCTGDGFNKHNSFVMKMDNNNNNAKSLSHCLDVIVRLYYTNRSFAFCK